MIGFYRGFHMIMSFLGSLGTMMAGSGLTERSETIYGSNFVVHYDVCEGSVNISKRPPLDRINSYVEN